MARFFYQSVTSDAPQADVSTVTADAWAATWTQPQRRSAPPPSVYAAAVFAPSPVAATVDQWAPAWTQPARRVERAAALYAQAWFAPAVVAGTPVTGGVRYRIRSRDLNATPPAPWVTLGDTAGLTYDCPPLGPGAVVAYQVNAYDDLTGYEDENSDARLTVRLNDAGEDVTGLPNAPSRVSVVPKAGGTARVSWVYNPGNQGGAPSGFRVYAWPASGPSDYTTPSAVAGYTRGDRNRTYSATLTGLADATAYRVGVRAYSAAGEEANEVSTLFTAAASGPSAVVSLTATAIT